MEAYERRDGLGEHFSKERLAVLACALCIILGGASGGGAIANLLLQIIAILILTWSGLRDRLPVPLIVVAGLVAMIAIFQLIPLPPEWGDASRLRAASNGVLASADLPPQWLSLSATPQKTVASILWMAPAVAVTVVVFRGALTANLLALTVVIATLSSIALGLAQSFAGTESPLYFYTITNNGYPVGFFANKNHLATLILCAIPCATFLLVQHPGVPRRRAIGAAATVLLAGMGLVATRSDAGLLLFIPALVLAALIVRARPLPRIVIIIIGLAGCSVLVAALVLVPLYGGPFLEPVGAAGRPEIWARTVGLIRDSFPWGTGLGSFAKAYALSEDPTTVTLIYVNHAHNEYLELVLELGMIGAVLIALAITFWIRLTIVAWSGTDAAGKLGSAISGLVLLHSLVDFPARTAAISALLAAGCALMMMNPAISAPQTEEV